MIEKEQFFSIYNLTDEDIRNAGITWEDLVKIAQAYEKLEGHLRDIGKDFINDYLYDIEKSGIHSYRYRTKEVGHLLEKVIRKKTEDPERFAGLDHTNFYKYITDMIGIRVFYLYREDWTHFHYYITRVFENDPAQYLVNREADFDENIDHYYIAERPKVYKRTGDSKIYDEKELDVKTDGIYRSLHYIIKYKGYYIEIQGRTLFEEGWSEIDHDIVYPYYRDDNSLTDFSRLLNRLSGMADEMSSYFRRMKQEKEG